MHWWFLLVFFPFSLACTSCCFFDYCIPAVLSSSDGESSAVNILIILITISYIWELNIFIAIQNGNFFSCKLIVFQLIQLIHPTLKIIVAFNSFIVRMHFNFEVAAQWAKVHAHCKVYRLCAHWPHMWCVCCILYNMYKQIRGVHFLLSSFL